ncbi:MAG: hypothetical protein QOF69_116 [Solirubrobacteraceae bacterium]|nr:hypothetical protein [Solirubrobacteraceae bacterium]
MPSDQRYRGRDPNGAPASYAVVGLLVYVVAIAGCVTLAG